MQNNIREIREDRDLTQEQLAEKAGTTKTQISKLERGDRRLTTDWLRRLAGALECHWTELAGEIEPLKKDEEAMLGLYRGLSEDQKSLARSLVDAIAQQPGDGGADDDNGEEQREKKAG